MFIALVVVVLVLGLALGGAGVWYFVAQQTPDTPAGQDHASVQAAVQAAVAQVLAEREATTQAVVADRERTVEAVVSTAVKTTAQALESHIKQGSQVLDASLKQGSQLIDQRLEQSAQAMDSHIKLNAQALDERTGSFEQRAQGIDARMAELTRLVAQLQKEKADQHGSLLQALTEASKQSQELHRTTDQLRSVLGGTQTRGQWGERMAEDVLHSAGFVEGVSYRKQESTETGRPDFTFLLPRGLQLNMDVKFPIDNYIRFLDADVDHERDQARRKFAGDVRNHIKALAGRDYIDPAQTVDVVLMFIPNESVYAFLHENDADIIDVALRQKVVLCSPLTLFSVLAVIRQSVDNFRLEKRSDEILQVLGGFRAEWTKFSDHMTKVRKSMNALDKNFGALEGTRTNVLQRHLNRIDQLQAATDDGSGELPGQESFQIEHGGPAVDLALGGGAHARPDEDHHDTSGVVRRFRVS